METNFFNQLSQLNLRGNLVINIRVGDGDKMQVSVLLRNPAVKDKVTNTICPMVLEGTTTEMDHGFFAALGEPLVKTNTFFINALQHQQSLDEASKKSAQSAGKTNTDSNKKKYEEKMKKIIELESKQKFGEAIAQMPTAKEFPEFEKQIISKLTELRSKHGSLSLFGNELPQSTDTETTAPENLDDPIQEEPEEDEENLEEEELEDEETN